MEEQAQVARRSPTAAARWLRWRPTKSESAAAGDRRGARFAAKAVGQVTVTDLQAKRISSAKTGGRVHVFAECRRRSGSAQVSSTNSTAPCEVRSS